MPVAVVKRGDTVRCELKTAPPDGFVVLRKMTWGEIQERDELSSGMTAPVDRAKGVTELRFNTGVEARALYEFEKCVTDHNLLDENEVKLNLTNPQDFAKLDPAIGREIRDLIDAHNAGEDMTPFTVRPSKSSSTTETPSQASPSVAAPATSSTQSS